MERHLPILQIIVPMIAAPLCLLIRRRAVVYTFALGVCWATFAMSVLLMQRVVFDPANALGHAADAVITYQLGGWLAPWGAAGKSRFWFR